MSLNVVSPTIRGAGANHRYVHEEAQNVSNRHVLGSFLYLSSRTRPDISTAVSIIGKLQSNPGPKHWRAMKHSIRYLVSITEDGPLILNGSEKPILKVWSDADWTRDLSKRSSRTVYDVTFNSGPIIWCSKLQTATAESTS